ncbi:MAG TPA: hypothetical protein VFU47_13135, partial [Armatimonadota bacterium]|nr:hypothetical protein [Armatimonadota bacterium]
MFDLRRHDFTQLHTWSRLSRSLCATSVRRPMLRSWVLLYHRVVPDARDDLLQMQVSCRRFEEQLAWLSAH